MASRLSGVWLIAATVLSSACSDTNEVPVVEANHPGDELEVIVVERAFVPGEISFDGLIEAVSEATVAAQTTGRVEELPFDVGDLVPKGSLIVRLTDAEQQNRVDAANGALAEANARLAEAEANHQRNTDIFEKKLIAKAQLDQSRAELDAAKARVESATAALGEATESLGYTRVHAPYTGTLVARHVQVGETVAPGTRLLTGLSLENVRVVVDIPQQHIRPLLKHRQARVVLADRSIEAVELRIPPKADTTTHTFRVLVELPQGDHGIFPGTLVKVAFVSGEQERLLVPESAIVRRGEVTGAYVVDGDGRISLRYLRVGATTPDGRVPVVAGLQEGDRVAMDPITAGVLLKEKVGSSL